MLNLLSILIRLALYLFLLLLLAPCVSLGVSCSVDAYLSAWDPPQLIRLATDARWFQIAAGAGCLLAIARLLGMVWNVVFFVSLLAFLVECLSLTIGIDWGVPSSLRSLALLQPMQNVAAHFPAMMFLVPLACVLSCFCSRTPGRIISYTLFCYLLWYAASELLAWLVSLWADMEAPCLPELLHMIQAYPWLGAALPGIFFLLFCLLMALLDSFSSAAPSAGTDEAPPAMAPSIPLPPAPPALPSQQSVLPPVPQEGAVLAEASLPPIPEESTEEPLASTAGNGLQESPAQSASTHDESPEKPAAPAL